MLRGVVTQAQEVSEATPYDSGDAAGTAPGGMTFPSVATQCACRRCAACP